MAPDTFPVRMYGATAPLPRRFVRCWHDCQRQDRFKSHCRQSAIKHK